MIIEAAVIPLIIGKLRGGKFQHLLYIEIQKWYLIVIAGFTEFIASFIRVREIEPLSEFFNNHIYWIHLFTYVLLILVAWINRREKGFLYLLIGILLNFLVIMVNDGRMPVEIESIREMVSPQVIENLEAGKDLTHIAANNHTNLIFLGDVIHMKKPYPLPKSLSIGDLFLIGGLWIWIQNKMLHKPETRKN